MPKIIIPRTKINKESLTTKSTLILIGLTAAVCGGYILFLAIAAPQQLAEATTAAASNVVCSGCVGSSDIADNSILSVDIANGRIFSEDIRDGQVGSVDIGTGQVRTGDILDSEVYSVDIRDGQVGVADIQDGAILPNIQFITSGPRTVEEDTSEEVRVTCPRGSTPTGGGFESDSFNIQIADSFPDFFQNQWVVSAFKPGSASATLEAYVICIGGMG
jgi:hypothetical protein